MPPLIAIAPVIAAVAAGVGAAGAVAGTALSVTQANDSKDQAKKQQQQQQAQAAQDEESKKKLAAATTLRDQRRSAQLAGALGSQGRAGTIATSGLGVPSAPQAQTGQKTLLGM